MLPELTMIGKYWWVVLALISAIFWSPKNQTHYHVHHQESEQKHKAISCYQKYSRLQLVSYHVKNLAPETIMHIIHSSWTKNIQMERHKHTIMFRFFFFFFFWTANLLTASKNNNQQSQHNKRQQQKKRKQAHKRTGRKPNKKQKGQTPRWMKSPSSLDPLLAKLSVK